jgi:DNA repair protein RecO (recombination protein O)
LLKKERVIILKRTKHGEADIIVHALNRHGARMSFFAKNAMKSRKRFQGDVLEPTHYVEVSYKERPDVVGAPLHILLEAQLVMGFDRLRENYDRLQVALYFLQVIAKVSPEGIVESREMFDLLGNALRAAETTPDAEALKLHFEVKVLGHQGVLPPLLGAEEWLKLPLQSHAELKMERSQLRALEWDIHHSLEAYLSGMLSHC